MKLVEHQRPESNPNMPENESAEKINSKEHNKEIFQRQAKEREEASLQKYESHKEQLILDPELQTQLAQTEKQIEELTVRGRTHEAKTLEQQTRNKLEEKLADYKKPADEVLVRLPMKALQIEDTPIALDSKSEKGSFGADFYKSETLAEIDEDKIDVNLLKKISSATGQGGKVYQFTEHSEKGNDTYILTEYSNDVDESEDKSNKVFLGYAQDHGGKYLKIFALDTKSIDGDKYTLEEMKKAEPVVETPSEFEKPTVTIVDLQMGLDMLSHDLKDKIDIDAITDEQIAEFNEKLTQDWTEVNNLLKSEITDAKRQQEKFQELKDDLIQNFLVPYSLSDPEAPSPYAHSQEEISEKRTTNQASRNHFSEKIKTFTEYFKEDGEQLQELADKTIEQKLDPEEIRKLADEIVQELQGKIKKLKDQEHYSEEGLINSKGLHKGFREQLTTQADVNDFIFFHQDRAKQIADLENGTWKQPRRQTE